MRLRNIPGSREVIAESPFVVHDEESMKGKWREFFGNDKTERKNRDNLVRAVQVASNKVVRASLGADKKPQYTVHFVQK